MSSVFLDGERAARSRVPLILRPTHVNHPCAIWTRQSIENYNWLGELMRNLAVEYNLRYGKVHQYVTTGLIARLTLHRPMNLQHGARTPWPLCMPAQYKRPSAVEAYRLYYYHDKHHIAEWRKPAVVPEWWKELNEQNLITKPKIRK